MSVTISPPVPPTDNQPRTIDAAPPDLLTNWVRLFEEAETTSQQSRELAEKARDYYDGRQFTAEELEVLKKRHQPATPNNKIKPKMQLLLGLERRGRSDPKAFPRTPTEDNRADVATQALRYIADDNRFDVVRSSAFENMLIEGVGGCEVIAEPDDNGGYDVRINHIPWERIFYDPHSSHPGFSDASYLGVVIWMDYDSALDMYPGCEALLDSALTASTWGDTYNDRPNFVWADARRRRVRMVQMHQKRGRDWWVGTFTRSGFVDGPMLSPYLDRHGRPTCSLILRATYTDRDNNRYGAVRDLIPIQDAINKRESKLLHLLNVNQIIVEEGAVDDVDHARNEAAKPDGVIVTNPGAKFEIRRDQSEVAGHFQLLQYSIGQMEVTGPNAAMSGKDPREQSGRAIIAQQSGGQVEHEPVADTLRQWTHKVYEAAWMRARQFWTSAKTIRVTDNQQNVQFVTLNKPVTLADKLDSMPPDQSAQIAQAMGLQPGDPRLKVQVDTEHDLDDMDVDITVEEGPDNPSMQAEQFQQIMQLPPQILAQFPPEFIIQASSLRNKQDLVKLLQQHQQSQQQAQQAQQAVVQQTQQQATALNQAKIGLTNAQAQLATAGAAEKQSGAVDRLHGMAMDHAKAMVTPAVSAVPGAFVSPGAAQNLAADGIHGDTMLAHINPQEAAMLQRAGGVGTPNPTDGIPQFYDGGGGSGDDGQDSSAGGASDAGAGRGGSESGDDGGSNDGGVAGPGLNDTATGAGMADNGMASHSALDDSAVGAMDIQGSHLSGVNAASDIMAGVTPGFADKALDFAGINNPGGFLGSDAALGAAGVLGGLALGPAGSALASGITAAAQGRGLGASLGAALGGVTGASALGGGFSNALAGIGAATGATAGQAVSNGLSTSQDTGRTITGSNSLTI